MRPTWKQQNGPSVETILAKLEATRWDVSNEPFSMYLQRLLANDDAYNKALSENQGVEINASAFDQVNRVVYQIEDSMPDGYIGYDYELRKIEKLLGRGFVDSAAQDLQRRQEEQGPQR